MRADPFRLSRVDVSSSAVSLASASAGGREGAGRLQYEATPL
jgi:hypothetical protein